MVLLYEKQQNWPGFITWLFCSYFVLTPVFENPVFSTHGRETCTLLSVPMTYKYRFQGTHSPDVQGSVSHFLPCSRRTFVVRFCQREHTDELHQFPKRGSVASLGRPVYAIFYFACIITSNFDSQLLHHTTQMGFQVSI